MPIPLPRGAIKFLLLLNLGVGAVLGGWYLTQPETRRVEVRRLVENALERDKRVSFIDVAWDVWQLYYAGSSAGKVSTGDKSIVYGGAPRALATGADMPTIRVLVNQGYVVGYSDALGNPLWAAYRVQDLAQLPKPAPRPEKFETDRRTVARISPEDYAGSGYDRGHLVPAADMAFNEQAINESFYMSNISPQVRAFNGGIWRELEENARDWGRRFKHLIVVSGPVLSQPPLGQIGFSKVSVPAAYYKILLAPQQLAR